MINIIKRKRKNNERGFTLIELILVIIILGIMAVGISGFITLSTQTYLDATSRDELIGNARFAIERLSRELRNAVPNSIRTKTFGTRVQCLQFTPIVASTVYTDIPVSPEPAGKEILAIPFNDQSGDPYQCDKSAGCTNFVSVYPLSDGDIYADYSASIGKIFRVDNVDSTLPIWKINIDNDQGVYFSEDSPTKRLYLTDQQITYCVVPVFQAETVTLIRFSDVITPGDLTFPGSKRFYMAGYLKDDFGSQPPFNYQPATLKRNAVVQIHLEFVKDDESYVFDHEVHLNNVP